MKNLIIIGARGYGREVFHLACQCCDFNTVWKIKGFLDDNLNALDNFTGYPPILGPVETYNIEPDDVFVCALGDVKSKYHYISIIKKKGGFFVSLVHPTVIINPNTTIGEGLIACQFTNISCDIRIGDYVTIQGYSALGHDVQIGNYCHLNGYTFLGGFVEVGNFCTINTGAIVIPKLKIGDNAVIGAGSVVIKNVPNKCTVFGNPAKIIFRE